MFGKNPRINQLAARKQLLIAESEINRVQLAQEWQTMTEGVRQVAHRAGRIGFLACTAASWISSLASFRQTKSASEGAKPSWWQTLLKGAQWAASLWMEQ
jgi:hypothetical protein